MENSPLAFFEHEKFGSLRVVRRDQGEPWFVASDVAKALGYEKPNNAVNDHCKKVNKFSYPNSGQLQPYNIIPESDVYRLVMRSNLPGAVEFQDWVCEEVIPSIRKTGGYLMAKPDDTPPKPSSPAPCWSLRTPSGASKPSATMRSAPRPKSVHAARLPRW